MASAEEPIVADSPNAAGRVAFPAYGFHDRIRRAGLVRWLQRLEAALRAEDKLMRKLDDLLELHQCAMAVHNLDEVSEAAHGARRILLTLRQARLQRLMLLELVLDTPRIPMTQLREALRPWMTSGLLETINALETTRDQLARRVHDSRKMIRTLTLARDADPTVGQIPAAD